MQSKYRCQHLQQNMSSKAAELLRALNSQIQHDSIATESPNKQSTNPTPSELSSQVALLQSSPALKCEDKCQAPECLTELLQRQIGGLVTQALFEKIEGLLTVREKNAYESLTRGSIEYINILMEGQRRKDLPELSKLEGLLSARMGKVEHDLQSGSLFIANDRKLSNKKQLEKMQQLDVARMIKIKDGQLRSKMDLLADKMESFENLDNQQPEQQQRKMEEEARKRASQIMDARGYALDSEKTKIAKDYVRYMNQRRRQFEKRRKQREIRFQQQQLERKSQLQEAQEMRDLSRHQEILQKIQMRRKRRQDEEKQYEAKQQRVRKMLSQYHRKLPIFKIKEKQFEEKVIKPQEQFRAEKLRQIRQQRHSMSLNQIKLHEQKYLIKLGTEKNKRQEQFKLIMKSRRSQQKARQYYKGSAHARMEQMTKEDILRSYSLRQASKLKSNRMKQYAEAVIKQHKPTVDETKKQQLQRLIEDDALKKKHVRKLFKQVISEDQTVKFQPYYQQLPQKDPHAQGNRFLMQARKKAKKKQDIIAEEEADKVQLEQSAKAIKLLNGIAPPEGKQRNLWQIRSRQLEQLANQQVQNAKEFEQKRHNIQNLDKKAIAREDLIRQMPLGLEEKIKEKGMLDQFYLQSIKQKMRLLE